MAQIIRRGFSPGASAERSVVLAFGTKPLFEDLDEDVSPLSLWLSRRARTGS